MNVLITGGAGFIGSHTAKALYEAGHHPVSIDDLRTGNSWAVRWGPLIQCDFNNAFEMRALLKKHTIEAVIHCAASAYVGESMSQPSLYFHNNVSSTIGLLATLDDVGVRHIVFASSCAIYGSSCHDAITESAKQNPLSVYGESKRVGETLLRWYGHTKGFNCVALRYFNVAGADYAAGIGEWHSPETHLIPRLLLNALGETRQVEIYGDRFHTPDGSALRDYVHVVDVARANVAALLFLHKSRGFHSINIGSGLGSSVKDVIATVERISGRRSNVQYREPRMEEAAKVVADISAARTLLNWTPAHSALDVIVNSAWEWYMTRV